MSTPDAIALVVALVVTGLMVVALLFPEKF